MGPKLAIVKAFHVSSKHMLGLAIVLKVRFPSKRRLITQSRTDESRIGCKTIVVLRDPYDVVVSFFKFFEGWFFEEGTIPIDDFAREFWLARGVPTSRMNNASYFVHLTSWYELRDADDVLIIFFEDLKADLEKQIKRVAKFISTDKVRCKKEGL